MNDCVQYQFKLQQMDYESLYQEFKFKRMAERHAELSHQHRIQEMTNQSHTTDMSNQDLALHNVMRMLDQYGDQEGVDVESSIPILRDCGILLVLESVEGAKDKLEEGQSGQSRLMDEAQFLFYLWNMIQEQEITCRELKEIIILLQSKKKNQLSYLLSEQYNDAQKVKNLVNSWMNLIETHNYYQNQHKDMQQSNIQSPISHHYAMERAPLSQNTHLFSSQLNYTCQLSVQQQKQLVSRLYKTNTYEQRQILKKKQDQLKEKQELSQCTFKPNVAPRSKSIAAKRPKQIKGFDKTISRMKAGQERNKNYQEMRNYKPIGENYEKLRQQKINPPKFLNRSKKEEQKFLFMIQFDLGRHKTNVKIRQNDTEDSIAERLCKIYSLNKEFYEQIRNIVRGELEAYYQELYEQSALNGYVEM